MVPVSPFFPVDEFGCPSHSVPLAHASSVPRSSTAGILQSVWESLGVWTFKSLGEEVIGSQILAPGVELGVGGISQSRALARQGAQLRAAGKQQGFLKYAEGAAAFDLSSHRSSPSLLSWSGHVCLRVACASGFLCK